MYQILKNMEGKNRKDGNNNSNPVSTNRSEQGSHLWFKSTCTIIGYSMFRGTGETCMSCKRLIKVRSFPGAAVRYIIVTHSYIIPLISKQPDSIILHANTNDAAMCDLEVIVKDFLNLKGFIQKKSPNCKIILSCPILRTDSDKMIQK